VTTDNEKSYLFSIKFLGAVVALMALSISIGFSTFCDDDTFWHIALGRLINNQSLPSSSPFTFFDTSEHLWQAQTWLFDWSLYHLWHWGGWPLMHLLRISLLFVLGFSILKRYGEKSLGPCLLLLLATHFFSALRPHMVAMICLSLTLGELCKKPSRSGYVFLLILCVLWQSCHGSWPLFFVCLVSRFFEKDALNRELGIFSILCVISLFVTPLNPLDSLAMSAQVSLGEAGSLFTSEWLPFFDSRGQAYLEFSFITTCLLMMLWLSCCVKLKYRPPWASLLLITLLILLTVKGRRFAPFLCLALVHDMLQCFPKINFKWHKIITWGSLTVSCVVAVMLVNGRWYDYRRQVPQFKAGISERYFPVQALVHITNNSRVNKKIFNDFDTGGYLVLNSYPTYKPFITGTSVNKELEKIYTQVMESPSPIPLLISMQCDQVLLGLVKNTHFNLIQELKKSSEYLLTHLDPVACVFTRRSKANEKNHNKALEVLSSWPQTDKDIWTLFPQAGFLAAYGQTEKAFDAFNQAIKIDDTNASLYFNRGALYGQQRDFIQACKDFKKALNLGGEDPNLLMHYGNALIQPIIGEHEKALNCYRKAFNSGYRHNVLINNYIILLQQFGLSKELSDIQEKIKN